MSYIIPKIALVEFSYSVHHFLAEWQYFNPDEEPTQKDYDEWVLSEAYETLTDPDYSPNVKLIEDN